VAMGDKNVSKIMGALHSEGIRGRWSVENGVFRVRDVSYDEDRLHSRKIAHHLSQIRNGAITLIRRAGFRYIPDGWRCFSARSEKGIELLLGMSW